MTFSIINRDQSVKAVRFRFQFNTASIAAGVLAGSLPPGTRILSSRAHIITPFDAGGTDLLFVGIGPGNAEFVINGDLSGATNAIIDQTGRAAQQYDLLGATNPVSVFVQYQQAGAAATAGDALFVLEYLEPASVTAL